MMRALGHIVALLDDPISLDVKLTQYRNYEVPALT